jgi:hypothetical protein
VPTKTAATADIMGKRSGRHPRRLKRRHERKETQENGRDPIRSTASSAVVSAGIRRETPKFRTTLNGKSEEAIIAMKAGKLVGAKGLCLSRASHGGGIA